MCHGDPVLLPKTHRVLVALVVVLLAAGCEARGERPSARLYQTYPDTEIRHLGGYDDARYGDYGYIALLNGFGYLVGKGVDRAAIEKASINGTGQLHLGLFAVGHQGLFRTDVDDGQPLFYDLWIKIEGCPNRIHMKTNFTGRLIAVHDKGGCLAGAAS